MDTHTHTLSHICCETKQRRLTQTHTHTHNIRAHLHTDKLQYFMAVVFTFGHKKHTLAFVCFQYFTWTNPMSYPDNKYQHMSLILVLTPTLI